jgi:hypothetical protein
MNNHQTTNDIIHKIARECLTGDFRLDYKKAEHIIDKYVHEQIRPYMIKTGIINNDK